MASKNKRNDLHEYYLQPGDVFYSGAKSKIGAEAYKKNFGLGGREGFKRAEKARDEADAEVRRETKGASGKDSLDAKRERELYNEFRRDSRDLGFRFGNTFLERQGGEPVYYGDSVTGMKKGGKVSSASKRADGICKKGKTKGRFV